MMHPLNVRALAENEQYCWNKRTTLGNERRVVSYRFRIAYDLEYADVAGKIVRLISQGGNNLPGDLDNYTKSVSVAEETKILGSVEYDTANTFTIPYNLLEPMK